MKATHIENLWQMFWTTTHPGNTNKVQHDEMRMAFFGGADGLMALVLHGLSAGGEVRDADLKLMDEIHSELETFRAEVTET